MTRLIPADSPRHEIAVRFGIEMQAAMRRRQATSRNVNQALGFMASGFQLNAWKKGELIPRVDTAVKIAAFLESPRLAEIAREAHTFICARPACGKQFFSEWGNRIKPRYCSTRCYELVRKYRRFPSKSLKNKARQRVVEMRRAQREVTAVQEDVDQLRQAVAAFCGECEPEGLCRNGRCPLRSVSPLPLEMPRATDRKVQTIINVHPGGKCLPGCKCGRQRLHNSKCPEGCACGRHRKAS